METPDFETEFMHEKVLSLSRSKFLDDFEINDVYRELENRNILKLNDLKEMQKCSGKEEKIDMLFFLLVIRGKKTFDSFLNILKTPYPWLSLAIEQRLREENAPHLHDYGDANLDSILKLRKELPKFVDFNIHRCDLLWKIRQRVLALNRMDQYLVVHGSLSQGKRWIVMDALCSYQIMNRTGGNIFWINCSKCKTNESILMQLERLFIRSQPVHERFITPSNYNDINNKILNYTESMRHIFEKGALRDCLLVLIDVQNYETIRAFDLNCKTLITTRDKKLLDKFSDTTPKVEVDCGFSDDECKDFFSKVLKIQKDRLPDEVMDIHRMCKNNPFVLSVIAMNVKQHDLHLSRWQYWKDLLKKNQFGTVEQLRKPIEESLKDLSRTNEKLIKCLKSLTIFTDDVNIPMKVLQVYWNLPPSEVDHIVDTLDGLYLLQRMSDDKGTMYCSLHHLYYTYLANIVTNDEKQKMHKTLVDGYRIMEALRARSEPFIKQLPNDEYFHYYIGYHLKECGSHARHIFPMLYYDFGFLEQKLRYTGLSNTLGDFKLYGNEIINNGKPRIPIEELTDFLANIEELLLASKDGCLLQYALSEGNAVGEEARKQAQMFKNRIWFYDTDHSVKYRQIIKLPENLQPKCINFFEPNTSLIAFDDNSIHLIDMSYEYQLRSSIYAGHKYAICDIQLFDQHHFVSFDAEGTIKIWSLKDTEIGRRRSSRQEETKAGARQSINSPKCKKSEQNYLQSIENGRNRFTSILVLNSLELLAAAADGEVLSYYWNSDSNKFELRRSKSIKTKNSGIVKMIVIQNTLMTVNNVGETNFHSLIDHAMLRTTFNFPNESPINVYHLPHVAENPKTVSDQHTIAIIFPSGIYQLKLSQFHSNGNGNQGGMPPGTGRQIVERLSEYPSSTEQNTITCCTITDDGHYLMLGTKKGIIVLDPKSNREILRSSISDKLTSIDVCTVEDSACKYMLISATKKGQSVVYVHGIHFKDHLMQWSTNKIETLMNSRDTMIAWFKGGNLFDVCEITDKNGHEKFELVAADLKDGVHTRFSSDNFVQTARYEGFESCITAISIGKERKFIGCKNGPVYEITSDKKMMMELLDDVEYLRYFEEMDVLIASSCSYFRVHSKSKIFGVQSNLIQNTFVHDTGLIIILKIDGTFQILDMPSNSLISSHSRTAPVICSCFNDGIIAVGSGDGYASIFNILRNEPQTSNIELLAAFKPETNFKIKSICLIEAEKLLLAVGFENGVINLYEVNTLNEVKILEKLESHTKCVESLHFSQWHKNPSNTSGTPIILVSLSSEICFWNITYILNNPMERSSNRKSARFDRNRPFSKRNENTRHSNTNGNNNHLTINKELNELSLNSQKHSEPMASNKISNGNTSLDNPWVGKFGSSEKPQLLSCIKFVGSSTKKIFINKSFTKFITIDNEGEVYYLRAIDYINPSENS